MNTTVIDTMIKDKATKQAEAEIRELRNLIQGWASAHPTDIPSKAGWLDFPYSRITVNEYGSKSLNEKPNEVEGRAIRKTIDSGLSSLLHYYQADRIKFLVGEMTTDLLSKVSLLG